MQSRTCIYTLVCTIALLACTPNIRAAEEDDLIAALQPGRSAQDKDRACQRLKLIGTAKAIPALAALLADEELSHSAHYALESMSAPEAGAALCEALAKTTGMTRVGIITSLAERREAKATAALRDLLASDDASTASAAAFALGRIGSKEACETLRTAKVGPTVRAAADNGLLLCAERLRMEDAAQAAAIYRELDRPDAAAQIRMAAFRGLVLSSDAKAAAKLIVDGLASGTAAHAKAALQLARDVKSPATPASLAAALPSLNSSVRISLIEALAQRGDRSALAGVAALFASDDPAARQAALTAAARLGDASIASDLAGIAASAQGQEQVAARQALASINGKGFVDTLIAALPKAAPAVQGEIARALGERHESDAVPSLFKMAQADDASLRPVALKALTNLVDERHALALMGVLRSAANDADRELAEAALLAACTRGESELSIERDLVTALWNTRDIPSRAALLRVIGAVGGSGSNEALCDALTDPSPIIQDTALRTLAQFGGLSAANSLLDIAKDTNRSTPQRVLALRGYWRTVGEAKVPVERRIALCKSGLAASTRAEETRLGLAILAQTPHADALKLAEQSADDPAIRAEAQSAAVRIAAAIGSSSADAARTALKRIADNPATEALRTEARTAINELDQFSGYIATWSIAGPYRQAGKQCMQLFDIPFAPEKDDPAVKWRPLPPPADKAIAWQADLLPHADGEQCVIYARARVHSPTAQSVRLDIGSDDGIKLWINGQLAHSNNTQRPIKAMNDRATAKLNAGWNDLLVKVTQNNMGFAFCLRIRAADGSVIEGLKSE